MPATPQTLTKNQRIGIIQQSKTSNHWVAPAAASAAFETQFYDKGGSSPEPGVNIDGYDDMNGSGGVMNEYDNVSVDAVSGLKSVSFAGYVIKETLAKHLIACFQKVTESATTPYAKQFTFADDVLDWSQNEGYLHSVTFDTGISGSGIILENALLSEYSIVIDTMAKGLQRHARHSGTWTGNEMNFNQTLSGTWTNPAAKTLMNDATNGFEDSLALTIGATALTALPFFRFEFKYTAGLDTDFASIGGKAGNFIWMPKAQFLIDIPFRSDTSPFLAMFAAGSNARVIALDNDVTAHADKDLIFSNTYGHLARVPYEVKEPYLAQRIEINIEKPTASGAWGSIIQLTDTLDGGY